MRKKNLVPIFLIAIFLLVLGTRLYFAFQTPYYSDDRSYQIFRQIESIVETGQPLFHDELSFGGREHIFSPIFHYIIAAFAYFIPLTLACKILPNVFASSLVFFVYLLAKEISRSKKAALFSAFASGFVPIFFASTINTISPNSLIFPLAIYLIYNFTRLDKKSNVNIFVVCIIFFALMHPVSFIMVASLILYLILLRLENLKVKREEVEVIIFSTFIVLWLQFIIYKNAFLEHGIGIIWQNIPDTILSLYFTEVTVPGAIYMIGIIPFIFGIYIIYNNIFKRAQRRVNLILSFVIVISVLIWLKLITPHAGLSFLGVMLVVIFSIFYKSFFDYFKDTKFHRFKNHLIALFFIVFVITSIFPALALSEEAIESATSKEEFRAYIWLGSNVDKNSIVLSDPSSGSLITSVSKMRNVIDSDFMLIDDAPKRFDDVQDIYVTLYKTKAIELINEYDIDYIVFGPKTAAYYGITEIKYMEDDCFRVVYDDVVTIYKSLCYLETR